MKTKQLILSALALGATSLSMGEEAKPAFDFNKWLPERFAWFDAERDNAENPYIQELDIAFRAQYQWNWLDPSGGDDRLVGGADGRPENFNSEFRRLRLGAKATVFNHFKVEGIWNLGGAQKAAEYEAGDWDAGQTSNSVDSLSITGKFKPVSFTLGKFKAAYTAEYRTSSSKINTIERSFITNQLTAGKLYGVSIFNSDKKAKYGWQLGAWVNGANENEWESPKFDNDSSWMVGARLHMATGLKGRLSLDYMHSFAEIEEGKDTVDTGNKVSYEGPGAVDVVSLSWQGEYEKMTFLVDAIAGFNVIETKQDDSQNVFGLVVLPTYRINDHFEAIFRYQLSAGSNACKTYKRYYDYNSTYTTYADLIQGFYFGMNYYVDPENEDHMRIMAGAEYINSHGTNEKDEKAYTGWAFTTAVRINF